MVEERYQKGVGLAVEQGGVELQNAKLVRDLSVMFVHDVLHRFARSKKVPTLTIAFW